MNCNQVITIGREFGSGGKEIGEKLAETLGVRCYDKELIQAVVTESGLTDTILNKFDEKLTNSFPYSLTMNSRTYTANGVGDTEIPLTLQTYIAEANTIKKIAKMESCVLIGRCADYVLREYHGITSVFIHGHMDTKLKCVKEKYHLSEADAKSMITKTDKSRAIYYDYYTEQQWGVAKNYNLCIDSSAAGIEGSVALILKFLGIRTCF